MTKAVYGYCNHQCHQWKIDVCKFFTNTMEPILAVLFIKLSGTETECSLTIFGYMMQSAQTVYEPVSLEIPFGLSVNFMKFHNLVLGCTKSNYDEPISCSLYEHFETDNPLYCNLDCKTTHINQPKLSLYHASPFFIIRKMKVYRLMSTVQVSSQNQIAWVWGWDRKLFTHISSYDHTVS